MARAIEDNPAENTGSDTTTVTLAHCPDYTPQLLQERLSALLRPLGGMQTFVKPGMRVLLKPNMLTNRNPSQGVTTHPELVRAVIRAVKTAGGQPIVGDSPASAVKIDWVLQETGFEQLCREEEVPLVRFENEKPIPLERNGYSFSIAREIVEADLIINLPKVKTHVLTTLTAAVKNTYGTLPGYQKATLHKKHLNLRDFSRLVLAVHRAVAPALNIADGIIGMQGAGPSAGTPVNLNFMAASTDAIALDLTLCDLLGINPRAVPYLPPSSGEPLPQIRRLDVEADGRAVSSRKVELPNTIGARMLPQWLSTMIGPLLWIRPAIDDTCIKCGRCVKACPAEALTIEARQKPVLTPDNCIGCCCCHEVCPAKAIEMTQSTLLNLIRRGRLP